MENRVERKKKEKLFNPRKRGKGQEVDKRTNVSQVYGRHLLYPLAPLP